LSFFKKLFGGPKEPPPPTRDVAELVGPLTKPAVQLVKSLEPSRSYFGGTPGLPFGVTWPSKNGRPLTFLACIDLESLNRVLPLPWLPTSGQLLFFYDTEEQPRGFGRDDRGGWAVLHAPGIVTRAAGEDDEGLPPYFVALVPIDTYPSPQRKELAALRLTNTESIFLRERASEVYGDDRQHQIGGWPQPIQNDEMEVECELMTSRAGHENTAEYRKRVGAQLESDAAQWRLLLQMDSDEELRVMWGDAGILYFWIREQDARERRFDKVSLVLQCY
jgi:uncharacterized protein YwqG